MGAEEADDHGSRVNSMARNESSSEGVDGGTGSKLI